MSEEALKKLGTENEQLKMQQKGLFAQLEAHKQMVNEGLATSVQLRTNLVMFQQALQEKSQELEATKNSNANLNNQVDVLNKQVTALNQRVSELTAPPVAALPNA